MPILVSRSARSSRVSVAARSSSAERWRAEVRSLIGASEEFDYLRHDLMAQVGTHEFGAQDFRGLPSAAVRQE